MSQRRRLEERLASLSESGDIIRSMKNLAFIEIRRLQRLIDEQREIVARIEEMAADFLAFHPTALPETADSDPLCVVLGAQRGFCGDFNESLVDAALRGAGERGDDAAALIAVGGELCRRLPTHGGPRAAIDGADVAEEIPAVLASLVRELDAQRGQHGPLHLTVLYRSVDFEEPRWLRILPPFEKLRDTPPRHRNPPLLNVPPQDFLLELGEQYLFAILRALLFESLLAENDRRLRHLDGAVRNLERRTAGLRRRVQALRQEEIIEEIEVILLNAVE